MIKSICALLDKQKVGYVLIDGATSASNREKYCHEFQTQFDFSHYNFSEHKVWVEKQWLLFKIRIVLNVMYNLIIVAVFDIKFQKPDFIFV